MLSGSCSFRPTFSRPPGTQDFLCQCKAGQCETPFGQDYYALLAAYPGQSHILCDILYTYYII